MVAPTPVGTALVRTELQVSGMTCGACANRVERRLGKLPGVSAGVNVATGRATVDHPADLSADDLAAVVVAAGFGADPVVAPAARRPETDASDDEAALLERFSACAPAAVPVVVLAMVPAWQFTGWQWLALALTLPVALWGGWPLHRAAAADVRRGTATMNTLVSLGTLAALGYSVIALVFGTAGLPGTSHGFHFGPVATPGSHTYLEVAAAVPLFVILGRYLEARARRRARSALRALAETGADDAAVLRDGTEVRVPVAEVAVGDLVVVRPGQRVPVDGAVTEGRSAVDVSAVTGESVPVEVTVGDALIGGSLVGSGRLVVRAERVGADTRRARIAVLVERAQAGKASVQRLADRVSGVFVPVVLTLAVGTFGFWAGRGATSIAFAAASAVLVVACPCALGLATPIALLIGTTRAARRGVLVTGPEALERSHRIDTVVLDKTGTLTTGVMQVVDVVAAPGEDGALALRRAGVLESASAHPIAAAVVRAAGGPAADVPAVATLDGLGVLGEVDGTTVVVGRPSHLTACGFALPDELTAALGDAGGAGRTAVAVGWGGLVRALLVVSDTVRDDAVEAVAALRASGLEPVLLTGDADGPARAVAAAVGIERVVSGADPADKASHVRRLQDGGTVVAMVGDGVNDAAALATADLGIALDGGADLASSAADMTVMRDDLTAVDEAVRLSRRMLRTIRTNLAWAFAYNVLALPVAAAGLLHPMLAGMAMAASSLIVVGNSLRLRSA